MMRIVYIANSVLPSRSANSIQVMNMCEAFAKKGIDITLTVPRIETSISKIFEFYNIRNPFKIKFFNLYLNTRYNSFLYAIKSIYYHEKVRSDIIYTRNALVAFLSSIIGKKVILEMHVPLLYPNPKLDRLYRILKPFKRNNFLKLVVISNNLKEFYIKHWNIAESKIEVLPDGVDLDKFKECPKKFLQRTTLHICYIGSLYKGRGLELIFRLAQNDKLNKYIVYGGEKKDIKYWLEILNKLNIDNLSFKGFIPNKKVPKILCNCDVLLMPYQKKVYTRGITETVQWMSPLKLFEYMASGRIILASDLPVLREVLNEKNAILLPPDDVTKWIEAINWIKRNPEKVFKIASQAKKDVENYTWNKRVEKILQFL